MNPNLKWLQILLSYSLKKLKRRKWVRLCSFLTAKKQRCPLKVLLYLYFFYPFVYINRFLLRARARNTKNFFLTEQEEEDDLIFVENDVESPKKRKLDENPEKSPPKKRAKPAVEDSNDDIIIL